MSSCTEFYELVLINNSLSRGPLNLQTDVLKNWAGYQTCRTFSSMAAMLTKACISSPVSPCVTLGPQKPSTLSMLQAPAAIPTGAWDSLEIQNLTHLQVSVESLTLKERREEYLKKVEPEPPFLRG